MKRVPARSRRGALTLAGFLVLAVGLSTPVLARGLFRRDSEPPPPDPTPQLEEAEELSPFGILLPQPIPEGYQLAHVEWLQDGDTFNVDMWWSNSTTSSFHIWESDVPAEVFNNPDQGPDPTVSKEYVTVGGSVWAVSKGDWGSSTLSEICQRNVDGISICVGSVEGIEFVERVAESLATSG